MFSTGLAFALASSALWGLLDASRKRLGAALSPIALVALLFSGLAPMFFGWAAASARMGDLALGSYAPLGAACLVLNGLANLGFVRAVQLSPLSLTVPMLSLTPVFTALIGAAILGELPAPTQWVGIACVVVGAAGLLGDRADDSQLRARGGIALLKSLGQERGALLMVGVALVWSLTGPLDKLALAHAPVAVHAFVQAAGVGVLLLGWLAARRQLAELAAAKRHPWLLVSALAFAGGALAFQLIAIQTMFVAAVETIKRAVGLVMSVLVGRVAFGEAISAKKLVTIGLMAVGTALIVLG